MIHRRLPAAIPGTRPAGTAADAMLPSPKVCAPGTSVAAAHELLADDHVHALLVVDAGVLLAVVERADLAHARPTAPAREYGRLRGRIVAPQEDPEALRRAMLAARRRRLAVVDADGTLLGLLCLKRSGLGFCSPTDVEARDRERRAPSVAAALGERAAS